MTSFHSCGLALKVVWLHRGVTKEVEPQTSFQSGNPEGGIP